MKKPIISKMALTVVLLTYFSVLQAKSKTNHNLFTSNSNSQIDFNIPSAKSFDIHGMISVYFNTSTKDTPSEILKECLTNSLLWQQLPIALADLETFYILQHGIEVQIPSGFKIEKKQVQRIDKSELQHIGDKPYFIFHTLDIGDAKALVRLYLTYTLKGTINTVDIELSFAKENNSWILTNSSL